MSLAARARRFTSLRCHWIVAYLLGALSMKLSYTLISDSWNVSTNNHDNIHVTLPMILHSAAEMVTTTTALSKEAINVVPNIPSRTKTSPKASASSLLREPMSSTTFSSHQPPPAKAEAAAAEGSAEGSILKRESITASRPMSSLVASSKSPKSSASIKDTLLSSWITAEMVWSDLIEEASRLRSQGAPAPGGGSDKVDPGIFMEVGMYRALQCLNAAIAGHQAYCVEPSEINFARVKARVRRANDKVKSRIHLYHVAAGSVSGRVLEFHSGGGTGDRVGHVDVWNMEHNPNEQPTHMTKVKEMRMDDIIMKQPQGAFLVKVDTQGFEPHVFAGLEETIQTNHAKFILLEYWPKGMDLMTSTIGNCTAVTILQKLSRAGYQLYQLPATAHPKAPKAWRLANVKGELHMPLDDFARNCQWYYDLEQQFPSSDYKMGYWSDILAVAPFQLKHPITKLGKLLFPNDDA